MQDPNPLPWGALDRYQAHFIVKKDNDNVVTDVDYIAKTKLTTSGHFSKKVITKVEWIEAGRLSLELAKDSKLNEMIAKQSIDNATIFVEPTSDTIRIRSKWDNHLDFGITPELFEIYDRIAGHVKSI